MLEVLSVLLEQTNSVAIIATHSPYVVREISRENVNVMTLEKKQVFINIPRMQTFGDSIDTISQFVFGDSSESHHFQQTLDKIADTLGLEEGIDAVVEKFGTHLNSESMSYIARRVRKNSEEA